VVIISVRLSGAGRARGQRKQVTKSLLPGLIDRLIAFLLFLSIDKIIAQTVLFILMHALLPFMVFSTDKIIWLKVSCLFLS
jgi:hypothetical protein